MKYRILFLLMVISCAAAAQTPPGYTNISARYDWLAGKFRTGLHIPAFCGFPVTNTGIWAGDGQIAVDTCNNKFYIYSGGSWRNLADSTTVSAAGWGLSGNALTGNPFLGSTNSRSVKFRVNNSEVMRLDSVAGFVGINTTSPAYTLDVAGSLGVTTVPFTAASNDTTVYWNPSTRQMERRLNTGGAPGSSNVFDSLPWYNVKQYGAVGDGTTDDRTAIQLTINTAHAAGGGRVYFPNGVYYLGSGTGTYGAQLNIPLSAFSASTDNPTIELVGETHTPQNFNPLQAGGSNRLPSNQGVILLSGLPVTDTASILTSLGTGGGIWESFNFTSIKVLNIVIRMNARDAAGAAVGAKDTAFNFFNGSMIDVRNCFVDVNVPNDSVALPKGSSVGLITPSNSNWVKNDIEDFWAIGMYKGIIAYEHANFNSVYTDACYYGLVSPSTNHSIKGDRMGFWRTKIAIKAEAASPYVPAIDIDQYNNERYISTRWFTFVADLEETNPGQTTGHIRYNMVSGTNFNFVRTNWTGSRLKSVGSAGFFPRHTSTTRALFPDSAYASFNQTTGHIEYNRGSSSAVNWTEQTFNGQSTNFWTTGKVGIGGNPNGDTYRLNLSDSGGAGPNMIRMHTTGNPVVFMNSTGGSAQLSWQLAKSGTVQYQWGMNFNSDGTPDFYVYDQVNALAKIYSPNSTSNLYLGANAFTGTGVTILNSGFTGIGNTSPGVRLAVGTAGVSSGTIAVTGPTSGTITMQPQAAAGTYNWNWPTTAGSSGQYLTSGGGGATAMTWSTPPTLADDEYTPTLTNVTNISSSVASVTNYFRIGERIEVFGTLTVTPTAELSDCELGVSLPVASALTASTEGGGSGSLLVSLSTGNGVVIDMDATNDRARFRFHAPSDGSAITISFKFGYKRIAP